MRALLVKDFLNEKVFATDELEVNIDYGVSSTHHSEERQDRHEGDHISNEEISKNVKAALRILTKSMIYNTYDLGERVLVKNRDTDLNIVGVIKRGSTGELIFKVITVMREPNFRNIKDTKIIRISNNDLKQN
jgi:hypothetical protein